MTTPEIWKPVVEVGKEHSWYSISNHGNLVSHIKTKINSRDHLGRIQKGESNVEYSEKYRRTIKPCLDLRGVNKDLKACYYVMYFPKDFFDGTDYEYDFCSNSSISVKKKCYFHRMVMATFRPIDLYPPERLKDDWDNIPQSFKSWVKETAVVNHIDHDPMNNHIDNLEWVTPKENARKSVEFYGGNPCNKNKIIQVKQHVIKGNLSQFFNYE